MELIGGAEERTPCLHKAAKIDNLLHIHPEDGNHSVCRNIGQLSKFYAAYT
jgi:hypothetical protein